MAEIVANGVRTHVQRLGQGPPTVVFLHGIVVDNLASLYFTLANPVAQGAGVLLYDLRGHGKSQRTTDGYDLDTLLNDLLAVLDAERISDPPILLGHSYGGLLALSCAVRDPERVGGLVLIDPPIPVEGWGEKIAAIFGIEGKERDRKIREVYDVMHGSGETRKRKRLAKTAEALVHETTLLDDMRRSRSFSEGAIAGVSCPVLAIYGDGSEIIACARQLGRLLPQAEIHTLLGCTHLVLFENTVEVRRRVLDWLRRRG